jgi:hypothetical protein
VRKHGHYARFQESMLSVLGLTAQLMVAVPSDTPPPPPLRPRVKAVEVSDWYNRRLTLHRRLSYASIPVFAFQWTAGQQVWEKGNTAPSWARKGHQVGAATVATIFTVNTVTGVWNLWDSRHTTQGRKTRYIHALSMLVADAGFTWAGAVLSEQAETNFSKRELHRNVALTSMGITVASGLFMKYFNK